MSGEPFNSEHQQAERLDEWITAAQTGDPPQNNTVAELRRLVQVGRALRADETFARQLEMQITQRHRQKRRVERWRRLGMVAAAVVTIFMTVGVFLARRPGEQPRPTEIAPRTTPLALAATATQAVAINQTESALSPTLVAAGVTTATTTSTLPPSATLIPTLVAVSPVPSATPRPEGTLIPAVATIVPAANPTMLPVFPPVQVDVVFVADSSGGITALGSGITDLFRAITSLPGQPDARFGWVTGEQTVDFTRDMDALLAALPAEITGDSGTGAWAVMLNEAVTGVSWRESASIKLIIGLADAHPGENYVQPLEKAAAQGITLHIAVLGRMDERDESGFREMAQITGGQLVVLAESGYTLNGWIVQLIAGELTSQWSG